MATDINNLNAIVVSGSGGETKTDSGLKIYIPTNSDSVAPVKIQVPLWRLGLTYVSATDKMFIEASNEAGTTYGANEFSYELTRTGDLWEYTPDSTHFGASGIQPGESRNFTGQIVFQRDGGAGAFVREQTKPFTLTVGRVANFSLNEISGLQAWGDVWDLVASNSDGDTINTWADRSQYGKDLYESTNPPTLKFDAYGRPCLRFDGSNDKLTSIISGNTSQAGKFAVPLTLVMACRQRLIPASATIIARVGSATPIDLKVINSAGAGLTAVNTATSTAAVTLEDNKVFVGSLTKASGGAVTVYHNLTAGSGSGTAAVTADTFILGSDGASAFAGVDIFEYAIFNSVLSAGNLDKVQRALCSKWGVNL